MKYPTVFSLFCALFFLSANAVPAATNLIDIPATDPIESSDNSATVTNKFYQQLFIQLKADELICATTENIKIEFEFHDIFVNEQILGYELMIKYHQFFQENGIKPGPQRQIHLNNKGHLLIGDFGQFGELLEETPLVLQTEI